MIVLKTNLRIFLVGKWWENCTLSAGQYSNGRLALVLTHETDEDGDYEPLCKLTVNLPEAPLESNEIFVKTWSENEGVEDWLFNQRIIEEDALDYETSGMVIVPKYKLTDEFVALLVTKSVPQR